MFLILLRGRKKHHFLFAAILFVCAIWDLGIFLTMIRNSHVNEVMFYGYIILPCVFLPALIFHFTCAYLNQPRRKLIIFAWAFFTVGALLMATGIGGRIDGVYEYSWGNLFRPDRTLWIGSLASLPFWIFFTLYSCWLLFKAYRAEHAQPARRHILYILIGFLVINLVQIKIAAFLGLDIGYVLPICMLLSDIFAALIGIAIVKHRLLDITVVIKKGTIYSALLALIIFIFSCSEHLLAKYLGDLLGEQPIYIHLISIAIVVGILMPVRTRLERTIESFFEKKKLEF
jgi:CDP-diglyceride synthetase